jgi:hypothetical protein
VGFDAFKTVILLFLEGNEAHTSKNGEKEDFKFRPTKRPAPFKRERPFCWVPFSGEPLLTNRRAYRV